MNRAHGSRKNLFRKEVARRLKKLLTEKIGRYTVFEKTISQYSNFIRANWLKLVLVLRKIAPNYYLYRLFDNNNSNKLVTLMFLLFSNLHFEWITPIFPPHFSRTIKCNAVINPSLYHFSHPIVGIPWVKVYIPEKWTEMERGETDDKNNSGSYNCYDTETKLRQQ